ncbi:MAG: hypothetical protein AB7U34_04545 [Novosphingobium sp.]
MTHDEARAQVGQWRGSCLNLFARVERAVGLALEAAVTAGKAKKIRHLSGQKLNDLVAIVDTLDQTEKQKKAFQSALVSWKQVESHRAFLAHAVALEAIDRHGSWIAIFDMIVHKGNDALNTRWSVTQAEAEVILSDLTVGFKELSGQLGQVRTRLKVTPDTIHPAVRHSATE